MPKLQTYLPIPEAPMDDAPPEDTAPGKAQTLEDKVEEFTTAPESNFNLAALKLRGPEYVIGACSKPGVVDALLELAHEDGITVHEVAAGLGVAYIDLLNARVHDESIDALCSRIETASASKHLSSARRGIIDPKSFSPAAYDRVMGALGFTPHIANVNVNTGGGPGIAPASGSDESAAARVGFDVSGFMEKHGRVIDIDSVDIDSSSTDSADDSFDPDDII